MSAAIETIVSDVNCSLVKIFHESRIPSDLFGTSKRNRTRFMAHLCDPIDSDYHHSRLHNMALSIELIHEASLVIDDIVDMSNTRRGKNSFSSRLGIASTLLFADLLLIRSSRIIVRSLEYSGFLATYQDLLHSVEEMVRSELHNSLQPRDRRSDYQSLLSKYFSTIQKKTATLFEMCALFSAICDGKEEAMFDTYRSIGLEFGILYQLRDDIHDYYGSKERLGKEPLSDYEDRKVTLPVLVHLRESATQELETAFEDALAGKKRPEIESYYEKRVHTFREKLNTFFSGNSQRTEPILELLSLF